MKKIILANPRGFCAGVDRAITIVETALENMEPQFMCVMRWCNKYVVDGLQERGAFSLKRLKMFPRGAF